MCLDVLGRFRLVTWDGLKTGAQGFGFILMIYFMQQTWPAFAENWKL